MASTPLSAATFFSSHVLPLPPTAAHACCAPTALHLAAYCASLAAFLLLRTPAAARGCCALCDPHACCLCRPQLLMGAARLVPTPRFFPLRLRLIRATHRCAAWPGHVHVRIKSAGAFASASCTSSVWPVRARPPCKHLFKMPAHNASTQGTSTQCLIPRLRRLAVATGQYVPLSAPLLEMLNWAELHKRPKVRACMCVHV